MGSGSKNYYTLLGVEPSATADEIRTAYMKRAVKVHPDRNPSPTATREFQDLADAYYTLSDPARRADYDQKHRAAHSDADDVFGDVFEDLLRSEVGPGTAWWSTLGMVSGAAMGFIVANVPGAVVGGYAGKKLGAVRDATGRPVYESFKELPHARKLQVLTALAAHVLGPGFGPK
ncbi:hypothetical protein IWW57_005623 [Coemansia sp. S610]|uniref:Uncharacterized protein n=1 Tax=Coemansia linderi TaxID=2663919 RepID=A0ACC1KJ93_9FUNG|nr:hypothetical protein LPJ60_003982 [Coemansia sp. RSA 2675]KAJ2015841.1 hypothetical protein IWW57_005623 [Coemansia sp. S610]KAJ2375551.1 hypothetical protein H4S02_008191 [Coemansia sp. RSA 2611]KAJ2703419.1 hypothetical protein H4218_000293 [Coemansia sp. IMI 209128]KAJ2790914.1 hypothetical protein GGI18_001499 [Coemansia linderi]